MSRFAKAFLVVFTLALVVPVPSGAQFGFTDVNTGQPNDPDIPAFPGQKAVYSGTCDLANGSTESGGIGVPPALRAHCIDTGGSSLGGPLPGDSPWPTGKEPAWRLDPVTEAGSHPDGTVAFWFNYKLGSISDGNVKDIIVQLPPGVVGNPEAVTKCTAIAAQAVPPACPASGQVGIATLGFVGNPGGDAADLDTHPVYGIEARDTVTAEFLIGGVAGYFNVPITARGRTNGDYGVDTLALLIPEFTSLGGQSFTFWGVPWSEAHDKFRIDGLSGTIGKSDTAHLTSGAPPESQRPYDPSWGPIKPFFTTTTECSGQSLPLRIEMDSWQNPVSTGGSYVSTVFQNDPVVGCDELQFDPSITLRPTVDVADSPAGLDVKLSIPQNNEPPAEALGNPNLPFDPSEDTGAPAYWKTAAGRATAHLKDTVIKLPTGTSFNPSAANGVAGCTTAQVGLTSVSPRITFNNDPHRCPENSKIGTLQINSPLLPGPLLGAVFAAPQHDNPFPGALTAIYMVAQDEERGLSVKLPGKVDVDPVTGQISTTFLDNPQLPFEDFILHLKSGPRAPINTPPVCGQFKNQISLIPWSFPHSGPEPTIQDPFDINAMPNGLACVSEPEDRIFGPGFEAGAGSTQAGAHTNLVLNVTREDGHQEIAAIAVDMPPGLTANLTDAPYCPEHLIEAAKLRSGKAETAAPSCPEASRIGTVTNLAGAGPQPLPNTGKIYIAGPFDQDGEGPLPLAPLSVVVVAPAIAGGTPSDPTFDLGNIVVRSAGYVDPRTAKVTLASTKIPYIFGGVPLRIRRISVAIDKPRFILNPTNCDPMTFSGILGGAADPLDPADDISVPRTQGFQADNCAALGFKPSLKLRFFGGVKRNKLQRLRATLITRPGDANISRASVTLPRAAFLAQENISTVCTRVQFAANSCPQGSIYGKATAWTPLLKEPLTGNVYMRSSNNPLPDLVADLRGQIGVELVGRIDSVKLSRRGGFGIRTTFDVVPDAPVTKFVLDMFGGKRSLIVSSENLCHARQMRAMVKMTGQNGRRLTSKPDVQTRCKGKKVREGKKNHRDSNGGKRSSKPHNR